MEQINAIIDQQKFLSIINSSSWPTTKVIDCSSKYQLLQHLVECEVYQKRQMSMICLAKGLDHFPLLKKI